MMSEGMLTAVEARRLVEDSYQIHLNDVLQKVRSQCIAGQTHLYVKISPAHESDIVNTLRDFGYNVCNGYDVTKNVDSILVTW